MKKTVLFPIAFAVLLSVLFCGVAFAQNGKGGFTGPGPKMTTVAEAIKLRDDSPVTLEGYIVERLGDERYTFKDSTGTVVIEIDDDDWGGLEVTPEQKVIIEGEVEKDWSSVEIEVDRIRLAN